MTFVHRLQAVLRRWPILLVCCLLGLAAGFGLTKVAKSSYAADAKIFVVVAGKHSPADMSSASIYAASQMSSYETAAASPAVLNPVISKLNLDTTAQDLASAITATATTGSFVLDISVKDPSAQRAADIANAIAVQMSTTIQQLTPVDMNGTKPLDSRVITPAVPDTTSASSSLVTNVAGLGILGLLGGIALALLVEAWIAARNGSLRRADDPVERTEGDGGVR